MKKFNIFIIIALLLICGCAPTVMDADNRPCRGLTDSEIQYLVNITRSAMKHSVKKKTISPDEAEFALKNPPMVKIEYRGDAFGTAHITWRVGTRIVGLRFDQELNITLPSCTLVVTTAPDKDSILPDKSLKGR